MPEFRPTIDQTSEADFPQAEWTPTGMILEGLRGLIGAEVGPVFSEMRGLVNQIEDRVETRAGHVREAFRRIEEITKRLDVIDPRVDAHREALALLVAHLPAAPAEPDVDPADFALDEREQRRLDEIDLRASQALLAIEDVSSRTRATGPQRMEEVISCLRRIRDLTDEEWDG